MDGSKVGVYLQSNGSISNSSLISCSTTLHCGIDLGDGGAVTNQKGGVIEGDQAVGIFVAGHVTNAGTIESLFTSLAWALRFMPAVPLPI